MKVAVVGATGMVGKIMAKVLEEQAFPVTEFIPVASARSVGKSCLFRGQSYRIHSMEEALDARPQLALFSAGSNVSKAWAAKFAAQNCVVIDNSSAFRMDKDKKLIVPEINGDTLSEMDKIIANPNCSTIQMLIALAPIHKAFGIRRLIISTYQSITGTGMQAVQQYEAERQGETVGNPAYPHPIFENCLPHCDTFFENGYTREELKLLHETHKILADPNIQVNATAVRVPVKGGHAESIFVTLDRETDAQSIRTLWANTSGLEVLDNPSKNEYPMPLLSAGKDAVFVGRLRQDLFDPKSWSLFVVADNLRKGAATNAVQIAKLMIQKGLLEA